MIGLGLATHYMPSSEYETLIHHLTGLAFEEDISQEERDEIIHEALAELETDEANQEIDPGEWRVGCHTFAFLQHLFIGMMHCMQNTSRRWSPFSVPRTITTRWKASTTVSGCVDVCAF